MMPVQVSVPFPGRFREVVTGDPEVVDDLHRHPFGAQLQELVRIALQVVLPAREMEVEPNRSTPTS